MPRDECETALYQCGRCGMQWTAPGESSARHCGDCRHDEEMNRIGTVDEETDGWEKAGRVLEHGELEQGYRVAFENEWRSGLPESLFTPTDPDDVDVEPPLITGEIYDGRETPAGPRYEVGLDTPYWAEDEECPTVHVNHWDVVRVLERTKASVRLDEIRSEVA